MPRFGVYNERDCLVDYLNNSEQLHAFEESSFRHYTGIRALVDIVEQARSGEVPRFVAMEAIRQYNEANATRLSYDEILDRNSHNYVFSPHGEWVVYTDAAGLAYLQRGLHTAPFDAFTSLPPDCAWLVLWRVVDHEMIVFRSPHIGWRMPLEGASEDDGLSAEGLSRHGPLPTYTFPPTEEGAAIQEERDFILAATPSHHPEP